MQTQKMLYALGLTSLGIVFPGSPVHAAPDGVNTVTEFQVVAEENQTRIVIAGSQPFKPEIGSHGLKGTTVITVPGLWQAGRTGLRTVASNGISTIRCGQFSTRPRKQVRVVANHQRGQEQEFRYELKPSLDQTRWEILILSSALGSGGVAAVDLGPTPTRASLTLQDPLPDQAPLREKKRTIAFSSHRLVSVDTRALLAAATRVASTRPIAPSPGADRETPADAPRLSLARVVTITPRQKSTALARVVSEGPLKPYPARQAEPGFQQTTARQKSAPLVLPPLPHATTLPGTTVSFNPASVVARRAAAETAAPEPAPRAPETAKAQENPLDRVVSIDFVNAELAEVLKLISTQANVNQVSGQGVNNKKVTLSLKKVPLRDALDWITRTSGLAYTLEGNTFIVGTGLEIAQLKRTSQTPEASSATIPFFYADAESLKTALTSAFPNVTINVIKSSDESKQGTPDPQQGGMNTPTGEKQNGGKPESLGAIKPRGGAINVIGTNQVIAEIRRTIEDTERGLIEIAQKDAETKAERMRSYVNDVYEVKYVDPTQAARLVLESVPNVIIRPGPSQRFIANSVGLTSAFSGSEGLGGGGGSTPPPAGGNTATQGTQGTQGNTPGSGGQVESRVLLLTGKPQDVSQAKEMLVKLDQRVPQFIYEARLVEVNNDDTKQLGLKYDFSRAINIGENDNGGPANTVINGVTGGRLLNGGTIFRTPYSISAQIDALASQGKANVLARPTLSALDGNAATTFIGDQVPYIISQSISPTGGQNIQTGVANAGIKLQVSGRSNGDGTMTVYVHPEISTITQFVGTLPQISTRFVDTTIRVKDGETIAIGGLVRRQDIDNMRKVPGLGDLPVIGQLFRSNDKQRHNTEVLIFITCSLAKD